MTVALICLFLVYVLADITTGQGTFDIKCGVEELTEEVKTRMDALDGKLDELQQHDCGVEELKEEMLSRVEGTMTNMEGKMTNMEGKMTNMEGKMTNVEGKMDDLKQLLQLVITNTVHANPMPVCQNNSVTVSIAPPVPGISSRMVLCDDPHDQTCEQDQATLCPVGYQLCSALQFNALNDNWDIEIPTARRPVGEIYCRQGAGAGHFTLGWKMKGSSIQLKRNEPKNSWYGSSRPQCTASSGCNEKNVSALCCTMDPACGNGVVDTPLEECDDGNISDDDDCLSSCTWRYIS